MNVLLIFPGRPQQNPTIPFSLLVLAAYLEDRDVLTEILDTRVTADSYLYKDYNNYDLIGLSVKTGEQLKSAIKVCNHLRSKSNTPIVWGGPHATFFPAQTCNSRLIDFVVVGEGETTLYELICALRDKISPAEIPGLAFKKNNQVVLNKPRAFLDMADLPIPAYHLIDLYQYQDSFQYLTIETSRGCPYRCAFCYVHEFHHRQWRAKPIDQAVGEIQQVTRRFGFHKFFICDDNFFVDKQRVLSFAKKIIEEALDIEIFTQARADYFSGYNDSELSLIAQSGVKYVAIGAESGSQKLLNNIKKDITVADILKSARNCVRHGMIPVFSFVIGILDETEADLEKTIAIYETLKRISPVIEINGFYLFTPYPGTLLFQKAVQYGYTPYSRLEDWQDWQFSDAANLPWLNNKQKRRLMVLSKIILFLFVHDRFRSYGSVFKNNKLGAWHFNLMWRFGRLFLLGNAKFRLKHRWFSFGYEWLLWGKIADRFKVT